MITTEGKGLGAVINEILEAGIAQGKQCKNASGCRYGDDEGNYCFVGMLLPEDARDLMDFDGTVVRLVGTYTDPTGLGPNSNFIRDNQGTLKDLQSLHDLSPPDLYRAHIELVNIVPGVNAELVQRWRDIVDTNYEAEGGT